MNHRNISIVQDVKPTDMLNTKIDIYMQDKLANNQRNLKYALYLPLVRQLYDETA